MDAVTFFMPNSLEPNPTRNLAQRNSDVITGKAPGAFLDLQEIFCVVPIHAQAHRREKAPFLANVNKYATFQ